MPAAKGALEKWANKWKLVDMLIQRILTSFALLFVVLAAVFLLPSRYFYLFIGLVISISIWEWSALAGFVKVPARIACLVVLVGFMWICLHAPVPIEIYFIAGIVFWIVAFLFVYSYSGKQSESGYKAALFLVALPLFIPGWMAFVWLRDQQFFAYHLLSLFALVASADIGAFFAGKAFGRHKLAENVSPNKTWEGFCGGIIASAFVITLASFFFITQVSEVSVKKWLLLMACAMLVAASSAVGDLFESLVKRFRNVKDSGTILPGHGGILDRIDGLTAAAPVYAMLLLLLDSQFLNT